MGRYAELIASGATVLTDAATGTRIRLETHTPLDPVLDLSALALDGGAAALQAVAGEYAAIARAVGLPIELDTMTYWASPDHLRSVGRLDDLEAIHRSCVDALEPVRAVGGVIVGGVIGPRADGYRAGDAMSVDDATEYHTPQAEALAANGVDVIFGATMSSASEATGLAIAAERTGSDCMIGWVVDAGGRIPDGTSLVDAVGRVDAAAPPVHHLITCTHPAVALSAMRHLRGSDHELSERVIGLKGNGAVASPDELESATRVLADPPLEWLAPVLDLREEFGFRVLGGCCGTDGRHVLALALALAATD